MPPGTEGVLNNPILQNAGLFGALMLFMIVITTIFLWYQWRRDDEWQTFIRRLWQQMEIHLNVERDRRDDLASSSAEEIGELTAAIREQSQQISTMAQAVNRHDDGAVHRHGQIMDSLGQIKTGVDEATHQRVMAIIRAARDKERREAEQAARAGGGDPGPRPSQSQEQTTQTGG